MCWLIGSGSWFYALSCHLIIKWEVRGHRHAHQTSAECLKLEPLLLSFLGCLLFLRKRMLLFLGATSEGWSLSSSLFSWPLPPGGSDASARSDGVPQLLARAACAGAVVAAAAAELVLGVSQPSLSYIHKLKTQWVHICRFLIINITIQPVSCNHDNTCWQLMIITSVSCW